MRKLNLFKYGLTALMMAFAMTLCFSCSSDDDEEVPEEKKETKEEEKDKDKEKDKEKENPSSKADGTVNGHDYVIVAGIKWATVNVGAVNNITPKKTDATYGYYYTQDNARKAAKSWGGTWKLPTTTQWVALMNCIRTWKTDYTFNGKTMNGYIVSDVNDSSKFIFLPAAGIYYDGDLYVDGRGRGGYYWSTDNGMFLLFGNSNWRTYFDDPIRGMTVRLVSE